MGLIVAGLTTYDRFLQRPLSVSWKDLKVFALDDDLGSGEEGDKVEKWCQPFPFEVPAFPVDAPSSEAVDTGLLAEAFSSAKDPFVPSHLPSYPAAYTYKRSSTKKRGHESVSRTAGEASSVEKDKRVAIMKSARQSLTKLEDSIDNTE